MQLYRDHILKLASKTIVHVFFLTLLSMFFCSELWALMEKFFSWQGSFLRFETPPINLDFGFLSIQLSANPGTAAGFILGVFLFLLL